MISLSARIEHWPIKGSFTISRGAKTEAVVVVAELSDGVHTGRGECVPYLRYGETPEKVLNTIRTMGNAFTQGLDRHGLQKVLPPGAARNALDCAFWDLEAKQSGKRVYEFAKLPKPKPLATAYTISLDKPETMAAAAKKAAKRPLLKIKLGGKGDPARIAAIRKAAPKPEFIVDANEGWRADNLAENIAACERANVTLIEQPLPADDDSALAKFAHSIPICADESAHAGASLAALQGKYDAVNIKLDKCGGLTEALSALDQAQRMGLALMVGCMVSTSLAIAPAFLLAPQARFVDLDGALLLAKDRSNGLRYKESLVYPPGPALWG